MKSVVWEDEMTKVYDRTKTREYNLKSARERIADIGLKSMMNLQM